MRSHSG